MARLIPKIVMMNMFTVYKFIMTLQALLLAQTLLLLPSVSAELERTRRDEIGWNRLGNNVHLRSNNDINNKFYNDQLLEHYSSNSAKLQMVLKQIRKLNQKRTRVVRQLLRMK